MEQARTNFKLGKISFRSRPVPGQMNDRMQRLDESRSVTEMSKSKSKCYQLNISDSPQKAMEFLSRSRSASSSNFFQILSTNSLVVSNEKSETDENNRELDCEESEKSIVPFNQLDQLLAQLSGLKYHASDDQNRKTIHSSWVQLTNMKEWLRELELFSFSGLSKRSRNKRKESLRFNEAQIHAALCVAKLASAIAGTVANSNIQDSLSLRNGRNNYVNSNSVLASAVALVATVCAEAAESVGARRKEVILAIRAGLETNQSADLATLSATAATSLRGVAALKQRAENNNCLSVESNNYLILQRGAYIQVCMPSGKFQLRMVSIFQKNDKVILRLVSKHLFGTFSTYGEYRILDVDSRDGFGEYSDENGFCCLILCTTCGTIHLLFQNKNKWKLWYSTIRDLLSSFHSKHNY